jgi:hypothetical protein
MCCIIHAQRELERWSNLMFPDLPGPPTFDSLWAVRPNTFGYINQVQQVGLDKYTQKASGTL